LSGLSRRTQYFVDFCCDADLYIYYFGKNKHLIQGLNCPSGVENDTLEATWLVPSAQGAGRMHQVLS
jgi:hypothetical protein